MRAAHRWLEHFGRERQPFFLLVDTFDPHEPWNPPQYYIDRYDPGYEGDALIEPAYSTAEYASPAEIRHMRAMYAGEVTMVDRWIGYLLEGLRAMSLWEETAVIVTSDHGFYHGEHNLIGKVQLDRDGTIIRRWPLYDAVTRVPLLLRAPGLPAGTTCDALCQTPDLTATLFDLARAVLPPTIQGRSLLPRLRGEAGSLRSAAATSLTYVTDDAVRSPTSFRTDDFLYIYGGDEWGHELYDLRTDAQLTTNLFQEQRETARELHARYLDFLREIECPPEILAGREEFAPQAREGLPRSRRI
jgi:arylsulfatase A-like enzyme